MQSDEILTIDGPRLTPSSGATAKQVVILLHGLGADGNDLFALAPQLSSILPDAAFVAPHAPWPCDMAPMGFQWFSLRDHSPESIRDGVAQAAPVLDAFIDQELGRYGLGEESLALVGFSQGTMMALHVAIRRVRAPAAVVGFSGALVGAQALASEAQVKPPVLLVHGNADPIVPVEAHGEGVSSLLAAGFSVESHIRPGLGHGIDETGLSYGQEFLIKHFAA